MPSAVTVNIEVRVTPWIKAMVWLAILGTRLGLPSRWMVALAKVAARRAVRTSSGED